MKNLKVDIVNGPNELGFAAGFFNGTPVRFEAFEYPVSPYSPRVNVEVVVSDMSKRSEVVYGAIHLKGKTTRGHLFQGYYFFSRKEGEGVIRIPEGENEVS